MVIVGELRGSVWTRAYYISFSCVFISRLYLSIFSVDKFPNCSASDYESVLRGRYREIAVIERACGGRNSAVTVIAS